MTKNDEYVADPIEVFRSCKSDRERRRAYLDCVLTHGSDEGIVRAYIGSELNRRDDGSLQSVEEIVHSLGGGIPTTIVYRTIRRRYPSTYKEMKRSAEEQ